MNGTENKAPEQEATTEDIQAAAAEPAAGEASGAAPAWEEAGEGVELPPDPLAELQGQVDDLRDRLLRAAAELENHRRRADREKQDALKFGASKLARDVVGVLDVLRKAIESVPDDVRPQVEDFVVGVELTEKNLIAAFERNGIRRVDPKGEKFDPNLHEAIAQVPGTGQPSGTVIDVVETGFAIEGRLLRPARVVVSAG